MGEILPDGSIQGYQGYCPKCKKIINTNSQGNEIDEHDCSNITPGEFEVRGNKIFVKDTYKSVATIHVQKNYKDITFEPIEDKEALANAMLFNASKDMLAVLEWLKEVLDKRKGTEHQLKLSGVDVYRIKSVIKKAKGQ